MRWKHGTKFKNHKNKKGLTQVELAENTGLSRDYISSLERGITKNPSLDIMKKLSKALDVLVVELFFSEEE